MNPTLVTYGSLCIAIVFEVVATSFLKESRQMTRLGPTLAMGVTYAAAFYFLSISLKTMPIGVAYAIWSGLGIVLISGVGVVLFRQRLDAAALVGIGLILAGVIVVNLFSKSVPH